MADLTTRRAIEICLSRLRMDRNTASALTSHLSGEILSPTPEPPGDIDAFRAAMMAIIDATTGVGHSFGRLGMMARLEEVRNIARASVVRKEEG